MTSTGTPQNPSSLVHAYFGGKSDTHGDIIRGRFSYMPVFASAWTPALAYFSLPEIADEEGMGLKMDIRV